MAITEVSRSTICQQRKRKTNHQWSSSDSMCCHKPPVWPRAGQAWYIAPCRHLNSISPLMAHGAKEKHLRGQDSDSPLFSRPLQVQGLALTSTAISPSMALSCSVSQSIHGDNKCCQQLSYGQKQESTKIDEIMPMNQDTWEVASAPYNPHVSCFMKGTRALTAGSCSRGILCRLLPSHPYFQAGPEPNS